MAASKMYTLGVMFSGKNGISPVLNAITKDTKQATVAAFAYSSAIKQISGRMMGRRLGIGGLVGAGAALWGVRAAVRGVISESSRFEVANIQFENLIGNAGEAKKTLKDLFTFAAQTPFEFRKTQEFSKGLLAAGVAAKDLIPTLRMLGDVGMGDPDKIDRLSYAYSKLKITGKATWRELTMFATAGVPIFEVIRKQMNLTQSELMTAVRTGKVLFSDVNAALTSLTAPGGKFNGMMAKMMDSVRGLWSNFTENLDKISVAIGMAITPQLKVVISHMIILTNKVSAWAEANQKAIGEGFIGMASRAVRVVLWLKDSFVSVINTTKTLATWGLRLLPIFIGFKIGAMAMFALSTMTQLASGAMIILGNMGAKAGVKMAFAFGPVVLVILAIVAGIALVYYWLKKVGLVGGGGGKSLFDGYDKLFEKAVGMPLYTDPASAAGLMTPEGRMARSVTETVQTNNSTANLLIKSEGQDMALSGDEDAVSQIRLDTGNQLGA